MVGVKGKFKGCNTCRKRRVACDQTRPYCKNCTNHGRDCEGYEKETVFIIGTPEDKGRCASHPPKNLASSSSRSNSQKKAKVERNSGGESSSLHAAPPFGGGSQGGASGARAGGGTGGGKGKERERPVPWNATVSRTVSAVHPPRPSWDECLMVASANGQHKVRFVALQTQLNGVRRFLNSNVGVYGDLRLGIPRPRDQESRLAYGREEFHLTGQCFVHLSQGGSGRMDRSLLGGEGICLFLYEHNNTAAFTNKAPWNDPEALNNPVRQLGPAGFRTFPAHHFFTRVYRPNAIFTSIINRVPTILAQDDWKTVPWETSAPKTPLDRLLDTLSMLPTLLSRADRVVQLAPPAGRLKARDLFANCVGMQNELDVWYAGIEAAAIRNPACPILYWARKSGTADGEEGQIPFADTYDFASPVLGLAHIYYWSGLIVLYSTMCRLLKYIAIGNQSQGSGAAVAAARSSAPSPSLTASQLPAVMVTAPAPTVAYHYGQSHGHQHGRGGHGHVQGSRHGGHGQGHSYDYGSPRPSTPSSYGSPGYGSPAGGSSTASVSAASSPSYFSPPPQASASTGVYHTPPTSSSGGGGAGLAAMSVPQPPPPQPPLPTISKADLPAGADPARYRPREIRKLAANVCRSLDWAVGRSRAIEALGPLGQPDLVAAPLAVVERFYDDIRALGDGELERLWCQGFRERLAVRGRDVVSLVAGCGDPASDSGAMGSGGSRGWIEMGEFGG